MRINIDDMEQQDPAIFQYKKGDIMLETTKRSSYVGKMRSDKNNADFISRMSLTDGESFLSDEIFADAIEQVYEWLQAFGRGVDTPYEVNDAGELIFTLQPRPWWDRRAFSRVERYIKEAIINYILYRWFEYVNLQEVELYFKKYEDYAQKAQLGMNAEDGILERRFNTPFNTIFS